MGRFYHQKPGIPSSRFSLQISIWVMIISWYGQYVHCAALAALSPPTVRYAIGLIFVELLSKTRDFYWKYGVISQRFYEYWSDHKSESGTCKSAKNCTIYVRTISRYEHNSNTWFEPKVQEPYIWNCGPVPTWPKTHGSMSGPGNDPAKTARVRFLAGSGTEPNRTEPPVKTRTTAGLPGPVANTSDREGYCRARNEIGGSNPLKPW